MKKNFLLAMVVMLMTAVSSFAQKEYNMVITLSNGTTVTLGHNDIKEITFNDGEVAISGNMVNTIDSLAKVSQDLEYRIKEVEERSMKMSYDLLTRTDALNQQVEAKMDVTNAKIETLESYDAALKTNIAAVENVIAETNAKVANTEAALQDTYNLVKEQSAKINLLNERIADLEALIAKYHSEESK
mgnify:CR=1 FL=1